MPLTLKQGNKTSSDPIRGYSSRGFITGWCAIMVVGAIAFGLMTLPLGAVSPHAKPSAETSVEQTAN